MYSRVKTWWNDSRQQKRRASDKEMKQALYDSAYMTRIAYKRAILLGFAVPTLFAFYQWYEYRIMEGTTDSSSVAAVCKYVVHDEKGIPHNRSLPTTPTSINRTIWDRLAPHFDGHVNRVEKFFRVDDQRAELMSYATGKVLEVGGGTCRNLVPLLSNPKVTSYTTIDFSAGMMESSVRNITRAILRYVSDGVKRDNKLPPSHAAGATGSAVGGAASSAPAVLELSMKPADMAPMRAEALGLDAAIQELMRAAAPAQERLSATHRRRQITAAATDANRFSVPPERNAAASDAAPAVEADLAAEGEIAAAEKEPYFDRWVRFYKERLDLNADRVRPLAANDAARGLALAAAARWPAAPFPINVELADVCRLPYADGTFDTVVDTFGLCSFEDPLKAIEEMTRVVKKPGGRVLLLEHGRSDYSDALNNIILDRRAVRHAQDWGCWWNRDIPTLVRAGGLKVVHHRSSGCGTFHYFIGRPYREGETRDPDILSYFTVVRPGAKALLRADHPVAPLAPSRFPDELAKEQAKALFEKKRAKDAAAAAAKEADW